MVKHTQWDQKLHSLNRKMELVQEQIGLMNRLRDIELELGEVPSVVSHDVSKVVEAKIGEIVGKRKRGRPRRAEVVGVATEITAEAPVKRKRGRPAGSRSKVESIGISVSGDATEYPVKRKRGRPRKTDSVKSKSESKSADLPTLLEVISQTVAKPMKQDEFVRMVRDAGYQTKAKDISSMVYQALLKLVKRGTMKKNAETREYSYAGHAA